ncbi:MAG: penicillin-binding transpeptidase domain-containing protein [Candidatus Shapirobacteria bacterium]|jgi:penicillin-binding protein 2
MRDETEYSWKYWLLLWGLCVSLAVLVVAVFRLTIIQHKYYYGLARENRIYEGVIPAGRGDVVDRKGRVIAKSVYNYFKKDGDSKIYEGTGEFNGFKFEGKEIGYDLKRQYLFGEAMGPITGYINMANQDDLALSRKCGQELNKSDMVGRSGIEEAMDCELRGVDGKRLVEVDALGKYIRELGRQEPQVGKTVELAIDAFWQDKVYKMLEGKKGVVIMSEPKTGEIRVMVSSPGFDANVFSYEVDQVKIEEYLRDSSQTPLLNRAIGARYHPGSVFKMVMATAGLESGVVDKNYEILDTGIIKVGDYSYSNWLWSKRGGTDGMVNMIKAIKRSNDIYFYKLGEALGLDRIGEWSRKFGYGQKTGIEIGTEAEGIVPSEEWKLKTKGEKWYLGNTYHLSIGQGDLSVTPLQVNQMTDIVANGGKKCRPTLLKGKGGECEEVGLKKETINTVIEGMKEACKNGGTAWPLFNFKTPLACKTGTAEVGDGSKDTHAWLTAFAPADDPQISITVMIERGGEGSDVAAPIVGDILKEWLGEPETVVPRYGVTVTPGR